MYGDLCLGALYGDLCLGAIYGDLCLGAMYRDLCPRDYVWRRMTSRLCMETCVSEHFVMTPSLCDSLP
ncbi:hypothetical protein DPMN_098660 [Dreissena polymorpha]|nr:hypothetical protein DPMN_049667 [Dreissena polymorpha]KAH3856079.1 hypothetical protein DPMN_098659 [Dreissena polymorpha]KAH3856080.1 hypothetical protein DPMN_098660 [Dreissena polymorpha]